MNRRALRAATMGVLLFTPVALTACSSGQTPQTATQMRDKVGTIGQVGNITLRGVELAYPQDGTYRVGDDARLQLALINDGTQQDTLQSITGPGFDGVQVGGTGASGSASTTGTAPTSGAVSTTTPSTSTSSSSGSATSTGSTAATGSSAATGAATATTSSSSATGNRVDIRIPADSSVFLGRGGVPTVTLVRLNQRLRPGQQVDLTFTFETAGTITLKALVAAPTSPVPATSSYNFGSGND